MTFFYVQYYLSAFSIATLLTCIQLCNLSKRKFETARFSPLLLFLRSDYLFESFSFHARWGLWMCTFLRPITYNDDSGIKKVRWEINISKRNALGAFCLRMLDIRYIAYCYLKFMEDLQIKKRIFFSRL